jgi:hypothetical protein
MECFGSGVGKMAERLTLLNVSNSHIFGFVFYLKYQFLFQLMKSLFYHIL